MISSYKKKKLQVHHLRRRKKYAIVGNLVTSKKKISHLWIKREGEIRISHSEKGK